MPNDQQVIMVETNARIRRSNRLKGKHKGLRGGSCPNKDCFVCSSAPPTLLTKVIRNLGETFGKIAPKEKVPSSRSVAPETIGESSRDAETSQNQTKRDKVKIKVSLLKKKDQDDKKPKKMSKQ